MKKLSLILIFVTYLTPAFAENAKPYGPFIIQAAWDQLGYTLQYRGFDHPDRDKQYYYYKAMREMFLIWEKIDIKSIFEFRAGDDPVFKLKTGEPVRTAVTGNDPQSKIVFNMDLINDPKRFSFRAATSLLIHELGHKINRTFTDRNDYRWVNDAYGIKRGPLRTITLNQEDIDQIASFAANAVRPVEMRTSDSLPDGSDIELLVLNRHFDSFQQSHHQKGLPFIGLITGNKVFDITADALKEYKPQQHRDSILSAIDLTVAKDIKVKVRTPYDQFESTYSLDIRSAGTGKKRYYRPFPIPQLQINVTRAKGLVGSLHFEGRAELEGIPQALWLHPGKKHFLAVIINDEQIKVPFQITSGKTVFGDNHYANIVFQADYRLWSSHAHVVIEGILIEQAWNVFDYSGGPPIDIALSSEKEMVFEF